MQTHREYNQEDCGVSFSKHLSLLQPSSNFAFHGMHNQLQDGVSQPSLEFEGRVDFNALGNFYREVGDLNKAKDYYNRALAVALETLGPEHSDVGSSYRNDLACVHLDAGDLKQAIEFYDRALAI